MKHVLLFITAVIIVLNSCTYQSRRSAGIRLNQVGFYPDGPKMAVVVGTQCDSFQLMTIDMVDVVYSDTLSQPRYWSHSGEVVRIADFSDFQKEGLYILNVPGFDHTYPIEISRGIHTNILVTSLKSFYYQRLGLTLERRYADKWRRQRSHRDYMCTIHPSAETETHHSGAIVPCTKGWYNGGDFNKYMVNSGITTYTLMSLYEHYPAYIGRIITNIPESEFLIPDVLDEARWNLDWILAMQDTTDGGVYHKLTHANFVEMVMPQDVHYARFLVQKSTAAALNFCATLAMTHRVFNSMIFDFDRFTGTCLDAALYAWEWVQKNPALIYDQQRMNEKYHPDVNTWAYEDDDLKDEYYWAAIELYMATGDERFLENISVIPDWDIRLPSWKNVETLGVYSLLEHRKKYASIVDTVELKKRVIGLADRSLAITDTSAYQSPIGASLSDFVRGSNGIVANRSIALIQAFRLTGKKEYLNAAISGLDYILGRNATGYCFMTGSGNRPPMFPHHRQSAADRIEDPIPGLIVGGPSVEIEDNLGFRREFPARCYLDSWDSMYTNEPIIDVMAAFVYLSGAIEVCMAENKNPGWFIFHKSGYPDSLFDRF